MSIQIGGDGVDVERIMEEIQQRIIERKTRTLSEEELRHLVERRLEPLASPTDIRSRMLEEFRARDDAWNFSFDADTLYRSSRGTAGTALRRIRDWLRPIQKLFWNPNPMISALSRQSDLNRYTVALLHNLVEQMTRLVVEVQDLKSRNLELQGRLELLTRREKALESLLDLEPPPRPRRDQREG